MPGILLPLFRLTLIYPFPLDLGYFLQRASPDNPKFKLDASLLHVTIILCTFPCFSFYHTILQLPPYKSIFLTRQCKSQGQELACS